LPTYSFRCDACPKNEGNEKYFDLSMGMNDDRSNVLCPDCGGKTARIFHVPATNEGLTAFEKGAGTTKHRADLGKFMRSERQKRKRNYGPGTREGDSNELWAGNEVRDGVIKGPDVKAKPSK
jgi:putative FmdB family regulatory protein